MREPFLILVPEGFLVLREHRSLFDWRTGNVQRRENQRTSAVEPVLRLNLCQKERLPGNFRVSSCSTFTVDAKLTFKENDFYILFC